MPAHTFMTEPYLGFLLHLDGTEITGHGLKYFLPLHLASSCGDVDIIRVLGHEADVNDQSVEGWTVLYHVSRGGQKEVSRFLHGVALM